LGLAKRIIPCLDVTAGRVVKGTNFVDLRDAGDPVEIARRYDEQGADEVAFLDITASSDQRDIILHVVEDCAAQVFIPLTVGVFTSSMSSAVVVRIAEDGRVEVDGKVVDDRELEMRLCSAQKMYMPPVRSSGIGPIPAPTAKERSSEPLRASKIRQFLKVSPSLPSRSQAAIRLSEQTRSRFPLRVNSRLPVAIR